MVVVGVHSAKFDNEKVSSNIKNAIQRYSIIHAVVNDSDATMWSRMGVQCWPTFVIVSPEGKCLLYLVGEGHRETLMSFVKVAVGYYKKKGTNIFFVFHYCLLTIIILVFNKSMESLERSGGRSDNCLFA